MNQNLILLGQYIKKYRKKRGYTRKKLAEIISVSEDSLYSWESGKKEIGGFKLFLISEVLKFDLMKIRKEIISQIRK